MLKKCLILLIVPYLVHANQKAEDPRKKRPPTELPSWIIPSEFTPKLNIQAKKPNIDPTKIVFEEIQYNAYEHELYERKCIQVLTQEGVSKLNKIYFDKIPLLHEIITYSVRIFRDGKWHDRTLSAPVKLLTREKRLEGGMYADVLSMTYFLPDLKMGDIVEKTVCLKLKNQFPTSKIELALCMPFKKEIEYGLYRFILPTSQNFQYKLTELNAEPQVRFLTPEAQEITFEIRDLKKSDR